MRCWLLLVVLLVSAEARAAERLVATRVERGPHIDGRLDDEAWARAAVHDAFVQRQPDQGAPPRQRTEVRVVYDDRQLYVAFRCRLARPGDFRPRLGRRDDIPDSDWVSVGIDTAGTRRTAFFFLVNDAGTQADAIVSDGQGDNFDWDGVWDAHVRGDGEGWTAELAIPFSTLRFEPADLARWGIHLRRTDRATREVVDWPLVRPTDASYVGHFAALEGIAGVAPGLALQLLPYLSSTIQPGYQAGSLTPRDDFTWQAGLDLKYGLTGALTLDATLNPDFAQVELDPAVLNLSAFEVYFPERRAFFLEGVDIFQSAGPVLYTRRIGAPPPAPEPRHGGEIVELDRVARILGAVKLTGSLRPGTQIGLIGALVDDAYAVEEVASGPEAGRHRLLAAPRTGFVALRLRERVLERSAAGLAFTNVARGGGEPDATVVAADLDLRGAGDYTLGGQVGASVTEACDRARNPRLGAGTCDPVAATAWGGKTGGEWRLTGELTYFGAELDVNDAGFLTRQLGNQFVQGVTRAGLFRPRTWGPLRDFYTELFYGVAANPNAGDPSVGLPLVQHDVFLDGRARWHSQWELGWTLVHNFPRYDDAETRRNERVRLFRRPSREFLWTRLRSPDNLPFWGQLRSGIAVEFGRVVANPGVDLTLLAGGRLQLGLSATYVHWDRRPRWVGTADDGLPLFGELDLRQLEGTLRVTLAFTRDLTLQAFSQLLFAAQRYRAVAVLADPATRAPCAPGACPDPGELDASFTSAIVNAVLRWQFRPGSTAFAVYTYNNQQSLAQPDLDVRGALRDLGQRPADHVIALKVSLLWSL